MYKKVVFALVIILCLSAGMGLYKQNKNLVQASELSLDEISASILSPIFYMGSKIQVRRFNGLAKIMIGIIWIQFGKSSQKNVSKTI